MQRLFILPITIVDWSVDRNDWVAVGDLQIGEQVKAKEQIVRLSCKEQIEGQKVYNFEIYREHVYLVSEGEVWVHNSYIPGRRGAFRHAKRDAGIRKTNNLLKQKLYL